MAQYTVTAKPGDHRKAMPKTKTKKSLRDKITGKKE